MEFGEVITEVKMRDALHFSVNIIEPEFQPMDVPVFRLFDRK